MYSRWQNQEEAFQFAMQHPSVMLDMDMGTGKTRVAIDVMLARSDVKRVLVVCPKAVVPVWRTNIEKFYPNNPSVQIWDQQKGTVKAKVEDIKGFFKTTADAQKIVMVMNYDIVWRSPLGDLLRQLRFDLAILDESHRIKAAGSKVSKYLALLGKDIPYKMCLSGTPMANSPLDVYGQYRFLDPLIFGTNYTKFLGQYAVMSCTTPPFVVGCKNAKELNDKFSSIAYTCKMSDIQDRLKLPEKLPPNVIKLPLSAKDYATCKTLSKDFIAECKGGQYVVLSNVLGKALRLQQITSGFCMAQAEPNEAPTEVELNTVKADALREFLQDLNRNEKVVVFCQFKHDIETVHEVCRSLNIASFELSGHANTLGAWQEFCGGVIAVQIQAGAEGVDMTCARMCVYYSLPQSLALYEQSKARLYRPGQQHKVLFSYLICENTIDELIYNALDNKSDLITGVKSGSIDFGYLKR
nr:MAG TPA: Chromatin remodeling complex ATPase [Caudoviricetes sp.]